MNLQITKLYDIMQVCIARISDKNNLTAEEYRFIEIISISMSVGDEPSCLGHS